MPDSPLTLVVLAAGMGSRYGGLKQLDPVGPSGEVILDYSVYDALQAGFTKVVFVIREDFEGAFRDKLGRHFEGRLDVAYAYQRLDDLPGGFTPPVGRERPWGTGHAVLAARHVTYSPCLVINADDFYGRDSYQRIAAHLQAPSGARELESYCMVGFPLRNTLSEHGTVSRGLCECDTEHRLKSVREIVGIRKEGHGAAYEDHQKDTHLLTGDELVSLNMWGFTPSFFPHLEALFAEFLQTNHGEDKAEFYIPFAVDELIRRSVAEVDVLSSASSWFGVTYREDKPRVEAAIRGLVDDGTYPSTLFS